MSEKAFQLHGQQGSVDELGIVTWTVPYFVYSASDIFTVGKRSPIPGLVEKRGGRQWADADEGLKGKFQVDVTYEGFSGDDPEDQPPSYGFDPSFTEENLQAHPLWPAVKKFYEGSFDPDTKVVKFSEFLGKKGGASGLAKGGKKDEKNPMFGAETYLNLSAIFRISYVSRNVPADLLDKVGTMISSLPGGYPTPAGRDWLWMPPSVDERGDVVAINEELMLSPPGGWPPKVYGLITI